MIVQIIAEHLIGLAEKVDNGRCTVAQCIVYYPKVLVAEIEESISSICKEHGIMLPSNFDKHTCAQKVFDDLCAHLQEEISSVAT